MKTPRAEIKVNGKPVASIFNERLIAVTITDKEGVTSDSIRCELNDGNPFAEIPRKGDMITAAIGYVESGIADFGRYTVDDPEIECLPYRMVISGRGANIRDQAKQHRARHWDRKTVKEIVSDIAGGLGLPAVIDDEVGAYRYEWFGQEDESDLHVVERLARRHNALFSIKGGKLIFAKKGSGQSASGATLTPVVATPYNIVAGTCRTNFANRNKFRKVRARIQDRTEAKLVEIEVESDPEGTADYTLPEPFADQGEAEKAADAKAKALKSETIRTRVTVFGDPTIRAGAPFRYEGVRPGIDGIEFIIETATHRLSKAGYTTEIEAKLKAEGGSGSSSSAGGSSDNGSGGDGSSGRSDSGSGPTPPSAPPVPSLPKPGGIGHA